MPVKKKEEEIFATESKVLTSIILTSYTQESRFMRLVTLHHELVIFVV